MNLRFVRTLLLCVACGIVFRAHSFAQLPYANSLSASIGAYAASGFGTNLHYAVRYNYFIAGGKFFVEGSLGFGSLRSEVLSTVTKAQLFETERLYMYEFLGGFDPFPNSPMPFIVFGVAGLNQGGQSNFAGVLGLGKRVPLKGTFGTDRFGIRYDVRDQIFSQRILNRDPFLSHNIAFTIGLQFYF